MAQPFHSYRPIQSSRLTLTHTHTHTHTYTHTSVYYHWVFFSFRRSDRYVVVAHCGFNLHNCNDQWFRIFFMCLLAIHIASLVKHLFKSLAHFKTGLFDYLFSSKSLIDVLGDKFFSRCVSHKYFLPECGLAFHLLYRTFLKISVQNFLMKSIVLIISLVFCAFCTLSKKSLPRRRFIALALTFTSMIHCKLIFVYGTRWSLMFFFPLPLDILLFQDHLLKSLSFFI